MKIQYILLLIILFSYIKTDNDKYDIDDFKQSIWFWKSKSEGTYEINTGLNNSYKIIGYLNNYDEKYTKLIVYEKTEEYYYFSLASYKKSKNYYIKDKEKDIFKINQTDYEIHNVIGNVFNNDNKICYLVTLYKHDITGNSDNHFNFLNYLFYPKNNKYEKLDTNITSKVFVADIDGDKILEIIYDSGSNRQVMKIDSNYQGNTNKSFMDYTIQNSNYPNNNEELLSLNGTNAFIDVNNDCRNDLIFTVDSVNGPPKLLIYIGVYYKLNDNKYVIKYGLNSVNEIILDNDFGPFALGDFNDNGRVDLIFPSLTGNNVSILLNKESRTNDWSDEFCPHHKIDNQVSSKTLFDLSESKNLTFPESDGKKIYYNPYITSTSIRTADFMSSGFHGILVIMNDTNNGEQSVRLYKINKDDDNLKLKLEIDLSEKFSNLTQNLQYASFFDFGEDGILDVIVVGNKTRGFYRNVDNSNYYVTAQLSVTDKDSNDYNLIEVGAGYHYVVTNNNGKRRIDYSWQLAQTGDLNLNLNYAYMGLGRTNNYLENLEIVSVSSNKIKYEETSSDKGSISNKDLTEYKQYTPIIPKSQLLVKKVGDDWNIDLIVQPTEKIILMIVIIFIILLIILAIIIYLHIKEVKEDKNQAKEFSAWYS